jgi:hypothetical protein
LNSSRLAGEQKKGTEISTSNHNFQQTFRGFIFHLSIFVNLRGEIQFEREVVGQSKLQSIIEPYLVTFSIVLRNLTGVKFEDIHHRTIDHLSEKFESFLHALFFPSSPIITANQS